MTAQQSAVLSARTALILLRWPTAGQAQPGALPRAGPDAKSSALQYFLSAYRELLSPDGHAVVLLASPADGDYRDLAVKIVAAARDAGFGP